MNRILYDSRIGIETIPLPTNMVIPTSRITPTNRDNMVKPIHSEYTTIIGNSKTISDDILYYIVYNADSIKNDTTPYNRYGDTFSDAITKRIRSDSRFRDIYVCCAKMLRAPTITERNSNTIITIDSYYRDISKIHTDIATTISKCLTYDSREYISTPTGTNVSISLIMSDIYKHITIANSNISKTITIIDSYNTGNSIVCPTTPVNDIKVGSEVTTLLTDNRFSRYNDKGIKDIIPATTSISTTEYISTLRAMRIDSGIAPSIIWTGNSRDYMIIGILDYDTTNYYVVYSSEVYTDSEIYECIYNDYNGIYSSYTKYAMDTSIQKYLSVFNDNDYVSWSFDVQGGNMSYCPITINKDSIHKSYLYDEEYYYYSIHKDNLWEEWDDILEYKHSNIRLNRFNTTSCSISPISKSTTDIVFVGSECKPTLTLSGYIGNIVDSINYYTDDGNSNIIHRAIEYINRYITIFALDGKDTTNLEDSKAVLLEEYAKTINKDSGYLYKNDLFDPYTEKMYKGRKGIDTIDTDSIYNPTYITSWKPMTYASHRKVSTCPTNSDIYWYRTLKAIYIDGSGGVCKTKPYKYYGGNPTTTTYSSNVPTLPSYRDIATRLMKVSDTIYNRWASTQPITTNPHNWVDSIKRIRTINIRDPKRSIVYNSSYKYSSWKLPTTSRCSIKHTTSKVYRSRTILNSGEE